MRKGIGVLSTVSEQAITIEATRRCWRRHRRVGTIDAELLLLLSFSSFGTATGVYFFNDKLEKMLNQERLPPLRWLAGFLVLLAAVLLVAALFML